MTEVRTTDPIDIVFDGPPGHEGPTFVEVEINGRSVNLGEWLKRPDGFWALRLYQNDQARLVPIFGDDPHTPVLYDIYMMIENSVRWIGSRGTIEQCKDAIIHATGPDPKANRS
jgi:hypothetical protein